MAAEPIDQADVDREYIALLDILTSTLRPLLLLPLAEMANANERMQALGPVLESTAYHRGGGQNLHDQRRVIDAALTLRRVLEDLAPKESRS
jgi:hypothetical protein